MDVTWKPYFGGTLWGEQGVICSLKIRTRTVGRNPTRLARIVALEPRLAQPVRRFHDRLALSSS